MKKFLKYSVVFFLFVLLVLVRAFEADLFYDPLIEYFKNSYLYQEIPEINTWKLIGDISFRYVLNALISLAIIYVIFKKNRYLKFAGYFYLVAFLLLILIFTLLLQDDFKSGYLFPFYIRRFLIHPLFILILLPTFFYQRIQSK